MNSTVYYLIYQLFSKVMMTRCYFRFQVLYLGERAQPVLMMMTTFSKCLLKPTGLCLLYIVLRNPTSSRIQESLTLEEVWFVRMFWPFSWRLLSQMLSVHVETPVVIWFIYCNTFCFSRSCVWLCEMGYRWVFLINRWV